MIVNVSSNFTMLGVREKAFHLFLGAVVGQKGFDGFKIETNCPCAREAKFRCLVKSIVQWGTFVSRMPAAMPYL